MSTSRRFDHAHASGRLASRERGGFTIVDLLVSIAVVVVLISILAPSLTKSYEMARRVVCMSNVRQIGYALDMYMDDHDGELPESVFLPQDSDRATSGVHNSIFLRVDASSEVLGDIQLHTAHDDYEAWDGMGILYTQEYLSHPSVFYCPSHRGEHDYEDYVEAWARQSGTIGGNYQFRLDPDYRYREDMPGALTLVADSMRTQEDYNHVDGNNLLRADMSVAWYHDRGKVVFNSLAAPGTSASTMQSTVQDAWKVLDEDSNLEPPQAPDAPLTAGTIGY